MVVELAAARGRIVGHFNRIARLYGSDPDVRVVNSIDSSASVDLKEKTIAIPRTVDNLGVEYARILNGLLDHEIAHVRAESDFEEGARPSDLISSVVGDGADLKAMVYNIYEDARIERVASARAPGVANNLATKNEWAVRLYEKRLKEDPDAYVLPQLLALALRIGDMPDFAPDEYIGVWQSLHGINSVSYEEDTAVGTFECAMQAYEILKDHLVTPRSSQSRSPVAAVDFMWEDLEGEAVGEVADGVWYLPHPDALAMDVKHRAKRKGRPPAATRPDRMAAMAARKIVRMFLSSEPEEYFDLEEGEIDDGSLTDAIMGSRQIFYEVRQADTYTAAWSILVDESGSMRGAKIMSAMHALALIGDTLDACRFPFEIWGWKTDIPAPIPGVVFDGTPGCWTRAGPMVETEYKSFNDSWRHRKPYIYDMYAGHMNDDAAALLSAGKRILERREEHKVLVVLTDGLPHHAAIETPQGRAFGKEQARAVIDLLGRAGITTIGVGLGSSHVEEIYEHHIVADKPVDISNALVDVLGRTIKYGRGNAR